MLGSFYLVKTRKMSNADQYTDQCFLALPSYLPAIRQEKMVIKDKATTISIINDFARV